MNKKLSLIRKTIHSALAGFINDDMMTRAAALAFYSALSFAPLLILVTWGLSLIHVAWEHDTNRLLRGLVGAQAADAVTGVVDNAKSRPHTGSVTGIIGIFFMLLTASAIFSQLQHALNRIWHVTHKPGQAIGAWLRARAYAFALLVGIAFMLIVSFFASGAIHEFVPKHTLAWVLSERSVSFVVFVIAFGTMYKVLPGAAIDWSDALYGAMLTAVLFMAGESCIRLYIDHSRAETEYGPAGAMVLLLTWLLYSAVIVLIGAELTRSLAMVRGKPIEPDANMADEKIDGAHIGT